MFPRIVAVRDWNHSDGDGTDLEGVSDGVYDFVHSSHSLEHMRDPYTALTRWLRVVRTGGYIICLVPDFVMYEHARWPSDNKEHTYAFTMMLSTEQWLVNVMHLCAGLGLLATTVKIERLESTFDFGADPNVDQTCFASGAGECAIEFILRKI
jgi:SAM-dependent methyltransferase